MSCIRSRKAIRADENFARTWGFELELERYVHRLAEAPPYRVYSFEPEAGLKAEMVLHTSYSGRCSHRFHDWELQCLLDMDG